MIRIIQVNLPIGRVGAASVAGASATKNNIV